jgi:O-antigen/teichoic acid export membrane protein
MSNLLYKKVKETGKHTLIFGVAQAFQSGIGIILLPIYTRYLTASELGKVSLLNVSIGLIIPVLLLGCNVSLFRYYYFEEELEKAKLLNTTFFFIGFFALLCSACLVPFASYFSLLIFNDSSYSFLMALVIISLFPRTIQQLYYSLFRASKKSLTFAIINTTGFLVTILFSVYLIVFLKLGLKGLIYSGLCGITVMFILSLVLSGYIPKITFNFNKLKNLIAWGLPFVPGNIITLILTNSDRYIISYYHPLSEVGTYDIVYKISSIINICFFAPFALIATPIIFDVYKQLDDPQKFYSSMLTYIILIGGFIAFLLSIMGSVILKIFTTPDYFSASVIIPIIAFSYVFVGSMRMVSPGILIKDKTFIYPIIDGGGCVFNIILNILFIPRFGIMAAAMSTFFTSILLFCSRAYISNIYYEIKYEYKRVSSILALYLLMVTVNYYLENKLFIISIGINIFLTVLTILVIYFILITSDEKEKFIKLCKMHKDKRTNPRY